MNVIKNKSFDDAGKRILLYLLKNKYFWIFVILLFIFILFYQSFFVYIAPDRMGLKQINIAIFGQGGLREKTYQSGWHFKIPVKEEYILFPKK
ncbi:hypothetical protein ACFL2K_01975, partial [Candidatus Margulisiibacteriota bacterium]